MADPPAARLDDAAVEGRLAALDDLLGRLDQVPGATAALGVECVTLVSEVYGEALARAIDIAAAAPQLRDAFDRDELLRHLMVLHRLHPSPLAERVAGALERVRPYLHSHGGDVELVGIEAGPDGMVARVAFTGHCDGCSSSQATMESAIRDALLSAAPELREVEAMPATRPAHPAPLIATESLLRRPVAAP